MMSWIISRTLKEEGEDMDYENLGLITDEEMNELSKVETDGVVGDTDELKSAAAGGGAAAGSAGGAAAAHM